MVSIIACHANMCATEADRGLALYRASVGVLWLIHHHRSVTGKADLPICDVRGDCEGEVERPSEARTHRRDGRADTDQGHTIQLKERQQ